MPTHHNVHSSDVVMRRLRGSLAAANCGPRDFAELLLVPGVGARTVRALALVAEVVHGAPCRFSDPARFSLAHGGKDRRPFPVPLRVYDETIRTLKTAVQSARLGREEELGAVMRLDQQARQLEVWAKAPSFEAVLTEERQASSAYGGRSVFCRHNATLLSFGREAESLNAFEGATSGLLDAPEMKPGPQERFGGHGAFGRRDGCD